MFKDKISEIEKNIPYLCETINKFADIFFILSAIGGGILVFIGFGILTDEESVVGVIIMAYGIISILISYFAKLFANGFSENVKNTYRTAEYTKLQAEIAEYKLGNISFSGEGNPPDVSSDELPNL